MSVEPVFCNVMALAPLKKVIAFRNEISLLVQHAREVIFSTLPFVAGMQGHKGAL